MANYRKIWEDYNNSTIPKGYEIHHIDGNRDNNNPANLKCVSIEEHLEIHKAQNDFGAVLALLMRMNTNKEDMSKAAANAANRLLSQNRHNFQKIENRQKRSEACKKNMQLRLDEGKGAFLGIIDVIENSRNAGNAAALKKAGFLNPDSHNHGSKHVKGTYWWTNIESGERIRSSECPGENWKKGMK